MQKITFEPLGFIETPFKERFGTPRQPRLVPASWGVLKLRPELNLADALEGLEGFSHVWLVFVFHENTNKGIKAKVHPPRMGGEKTGLFATRTPHRPNPIGLSAVKLERVEGGTLYFSGVDLLHGTPILDIKPYLPSADCLPDATGGWAQAKPERTLRVEFSDKGLADIARLIGAKGIAGLTGAAAEERFREAIRQILELDPRPNFYKGTSDEPNPYTDVYGFRLDDFNVVYRMQRMQDEVATVIELQAWDEFRPATWKHLSSKGDK